MEYLKGLFVRLALCFVPVSLFSFFLTPITVYASYLLINIFFDTVVKGNVIVVNGFPFEIVEACVATLAYFFLWLLCMLTKDVETKTRLKIIGFGFILIFGMNIIRIFLLVFIALKYSFNWFSLVHLAFWNFVSGVYVALVWIFLVRKYKIKNIPVYDDLKTVYNMIFSRKKSRR